MHTTLSSRLLWSLFLCVASQICSAQELRDLLIKVPAKEFKLRGEQASLWTVKDVDPSSPMFGRTFVWIRLEGAAQWRVRDIQKSGPSQTLIQGDLPYECDVSVQGGFFGNRPDGGGHYPLGLLISDGKQLNKKTSWKTGGVIYYKDGATNISHISQIPATFTAQQAVQSKPMLIEHGKSGIYSPKNDSPYDRVAVGISKAGNIVVVGVFSPTRGGATLFEFASAVTYFGSLRKDPLHTALAMDGGPGAHIFVPSLNTLFGYEGETFVPNVIDFGVNRQKRK